MNSVKKTVYMRNRMNEDELAKTKYYIHNEVEGFDTQKLWEFYEKVRKELLICPPVDFSTHRLARYDDMHEISPYQYVWEAYLVRGGLVIAELNGRFNQARDEKNWLLFAEKNGILETLILRITPSCEELENKIERRIAYYTGEVQSPIITKIERL